MSDNIPLNTPLNLEVNNAPRDNPLELTRADLNRINQQILRSYYYFKDSSPLREFLTKKKGTVSHRNTLQAILAALRDILRDERQYDPRNPAIILCSNEMETVVNMKALHVCQIREIIYDQLIRIPSHLQEEARLAAVNSACNVLACRPALRPNSVFMLRDSRVAQELSNSIFARFTIQDPLLRGLLLSQGLITPIELYFSFRVLVSIFMRYLAIHQDMLVDPRNPWVYIITDSELGPILGMDAFHLMQMEAILHAHIRIHHMSDTSEE
jgi:hypothetical protein